MKKPTVRVPGGLQPNRGKAPPVMNPTNAGRQAMARATRPPRMTRLAAARARVPRGLMNV